MVILAAAALSTWIMLDPVGSGADPRWIEWQYAAQDVSPAGAGAAAPLWLALDQTSTQACPIASTPRGGRRMICDRMNPNVGDRYRDRFCNTAGCGGWSDPLPNLACVPVTGRAAGGGCPCTIWPSAPGCSP